MAYAELGQTTIKRVKSLHKSRKRKRDKLYFIEGHRLVAEALVSDVHVVEVLCTSDMLDMQGVMLAKRKKVPIRTCTTQQFQEMSDTVSPQGIMAVVTMPAQSTEPITTNAIVLDGVADPGNAGTIVRTAEWFGFKTVVFTEDAIDPFNPKFLRSTMGSCFRVDVRTCAREELRSLLSEHYLIATVLGGENVSMVSSDKQLALAIGNEAHGVSPSVQEIADVLAEVPGASSTESLNAAVAAGISMYALTYAKGLL